MGPMFLWDMRASFSEETTYELISKKQDLIGKV